MTHPAVARAEAFCAAYDLRIPILQAPMASASPPSLAIAVANAGGLGGCGALMMQPAAISAWASEVRAASNGAIPPPKPRCASFSLAGDRQWQQRLAIRQCRISRRNAMRCCRPGQR